MKAHKLLVFSFLLLLFSVLPIGARSQQLWGYYDYTTGASDTMWITLTDPDTVLPTYTERNNPSYSSRVSDAIQLPFPFLLLGYITNVVNVHKNGVLILGNSFYNNPFPETPLPNWPFSFPFMMPYGTRAFWDDNSSLVLCQTFGTEGSRTTVFEFIMKKNVNSVLDLHWQIQLKENTQEFLFVYKPNFDSYQSPYGQIGWRDAIGNGFVSINSSSHTISTNWPTSSYLEWPGSWRWYSFKPHVLPCLPVSHIHANVDRYSAHVEWERNACHEYFIVEYGLSNFAPGMGAQVLTSNAWIDINNLEPGTDYEVRVTPVCADTIAPQVSVTFRTSCSNLNFTNLYDTNVVCRTGYWTDPSSTVEVVDYGSNSIQSRHTIHYDTTERDVRTSSIMRTIPPGHCMSVRLGNWNTGSQEEDISYTFRIDTNEHDLLVLRYAIVEENPGHEEANQPHFTLDIKDSAGNHLGECSFANFVSGDSTGWILTPNQRVVWHDWSAMGLVLAAYHGQRIVVQLSNYDCSLTGHFGYAYFTLEWGIKNLVSTGCGTVTENTYRAPDGFNYRWYNDNNPSVTLSTADTLHVTAPGSYGCHVSFRLMNNDCGFDIHTRAGARYPLARFVTTNLDSCGSLRRFTSRSVVTYDAAHTQLTNEPCEQHLWLFDDGTSDTLDRVVHRFTAGTHTVTLVAMIGGGTCRDSVSQTFTVDIPSDTVRTTICPGTLAPIGNLLAIDSGTYVYVNDCMEHVVHISWYDTTSGHFFDTICDGDELVVGDDHYDSTGTYLAYTLPDVHRCDSQIYLHLTVMNREQDSVVYRTVCDGSSLEYYGHTYSAEGEYIIDTLRWVHGCPIHHILNLTVLPTYDTSLYFTAECGSLYTFADTQYQAPGRYYINLHTIDQCDSIVRLRLGCFNTIDTTVCHTALPIVWEGFTFDQAGSRTEHYLSQAYTDSIVTYLLQVRNSAVPQIETILSCRPVPHHIVTLAGPYHYTWYTQPDNIDAEDSVADTLFLIHVVPQEPTWVVIYSDWPDEPSCPSADSVLLLPSSLFHLGLQVTPSFLTTDNLVLRATETGNNVLDRQWYIDHLLQSETGQVLEYEASPMADSVIVTVTGRNGECADTLSCTVHVKKSILWFPNVFTPGENRNTFFRAYGTGITDFELWIYDRRGVLVFHTTDMEQGWDGTTSTGQSDKIHCRQESYAYTCRYTTAAAGWQTCTGTVTLLR